MENLQCLAELSLSKKLLRRVTLQDISILAGGLLLVFLYFASLVRASKRRNDLELKLIESTGFDYKILELVTKVPNAFCTSLIPRTIFMTRGLVKMCTERELIAVALHEIAHLKTYDSFTLLLSVLAARAGLTGVIARATNFVIKQRIGGPALRSALVASIVGLTALSEVVAIAFLMRMQEKRSDAYTVKFGYAQDLASALQKIEEYSKKKEFCGFLCRVNKKIGNIFASHPETEERVESLLKKEETWKKIQEQDKQGLKNLIQKHLVGEQE